jgi:ribonucleoside-diphosphate reductase alpha chain
MRVLKRNGQFEYFDFKKVEKVIRFACPSDEFVDTFIRELEVHIKDGVTTKELQETLIQFASEQITADTPQWDKVASKLYLYDMYKEAGINRGYSKTFGYGSFYKLLVKLDVMKLYDRDILDGFSKSEIEELGAYINHERDYDLSYIGAVTLMKRYCIRGRNREIYELPQEAFMGVAMKIALGEAPENRVAAAKAAYDTMSELDFTEATPTMSNARKPKGQLSSCFIGMADDSLENIMYSNGALFAEVSKWGGGMGMYIGKVRALASPIRGFMNMSGGTPPWIRIMNDTAIACNQLGVRAGAISITLDAWHKDIFEFLDIKKDTGDLRRKAHDIFPSISMPDLIYKQAFTKDRVRDGKFYLFCPHEIRIAMGYSLEDFWGEEFEKRYWECVDNPELDKVEVDPMEIFKKIAEVDSETGTPFLFNRDTVNRDNPNKHKGMIYSTNLCVEICQNMSTQGPVRKYTRTLEDGTIVAGEEREVGDFVVCNLGTLNVGRVYTKEKIFEVMPTIVRMLDNVITVNTLPVEQGKITNENYRALGIGLGGWAHALAINSIRWESEEHIAFADQIAEWVAMAAIKASALLGAEKGSYPYFEGSEFNTGEFFVRRGYVARDAEGNIAPIEGKEEWYEVALLAMKAMRNGYLLAVAPNGSSSHYGGYTQSIDPVFGWVFHDGKKGQVLPVVAPDLDKVNPLLYYKRAHTIDQKYSIRANAARQKHIDQSQSFNLYITPETTGQQLITYYAMIWKAGIKTKYYTRNMSAELEDDCEACKA